MPSLYIIDGHAQFFRAYYAIRTPMSSPVNGEPTNMVYGFTSMLLKLIREEKPEHLAVVIDVADDQETFRSEIDPEYKANRDPAPDDFGSQVEKCLDILEALNIPVYGEPVVEADDVIASLVKRMRIDEPELDIRVISRDKDLTQLIDDRVELFDAHKGQRVLPDDVFKTPGMNIPPEKVGDILAMMGDTSDNIPGVPGIGPKTAAKLIMEFGSIDGVYQNIDQIKGKRKENLLASRDILKRSRQLVTLKDDVAFEFELSETRSDPTAWNADAINALFRELGFNRFPEEIQRLALGEISEEQSTGTQAKGTSQPIVGGLFAMGPDRDHPAYKAGYTLIDTQKKLTTLVKQCMAASLIAVDTETTGLNPMSAELCGISISLGAGHGAYIPTKCHEKHLDQEVVVEALRPIFENEAIAIVGHNIKYDLVVLHNAGIEVCGQLHDTLIAAWLCDASRSGYSMDAVALGMLGYTCISISDLIGKGKSQVTFDAVPLIDACPYAAEDVDITYQLWNALEPQLELKNLRGLYNDIEMPLVRVLASMRVIGVKADKAELERQRQKLGVRIEELKKEIDAAAPYAFNPDSPKQLSEVLFNNPTDEPSGLGIKPIKRGKSFHSTNVEVLEKLATDPDVHTLLPKFILEYRKLTKLMNTYVVSLGEAINKNTGRIHASFNQTGTSTGRLSSSDPNLQNIPIRTEVGREIRKAFIPEEGNVLIAADYSQVELRMLAHLSKDEALKQAFLEGQDIHRAVASEVFGTSIDEVSSEQRSAAKAVNFGIVYGITSWGLARGLDCEPSRAAAIIEDYKSKFKGIQTFLDACISQASACGYVETIMHRRRAIRSADSTNPQQRAAAERVSINSVVQGSAADLIKIAMNNVHHGLLEQFPDAHLLMQIHDELVIEAPASQAEDVQHLLVNLMESAMVLDVPIVADSSIGTSWAACK
ncbi:MAG: DNA polymerase I [Phycisphaerales bacterium]|jgi:DNA polymerase-1|nr:DNA polymerase I [Phycisphaerales bacterium]